MSDFNYQEYLKNNPLLQKEVEENKLITESQEITEEEMSFDDDIDHKTNKNDFAFWYRAGARGKAQALKAKELLTKNGIDADYSKGPFYISFENSDVEERVVQQMLRDANLGRFVIMRDENLSEEEIQEGAPGFQHDCAAHVMHESHGYGLCLEGRHTLVETTDGHAEVTHYDVMFKSGEIVEKIPVNELKILTSESHSHSKYEEDDVEEVMGIDRKGNKKPDVEMSKAAKAKADAKSMKEEEVEEAEIELSQDEMDDLHKDGEVKKGDDTIKYKMKVSELKAKIKEDIINMLSEQDDEEVEVEDEVEMDMDVEAPAMDAAPAAGLSKDEQEIQDSLKLAYDNAIAIGDEKLADQIGNSITFFTRTHVVER